MDRGRQKISQKQKAPEPPMIAGRVPPHDLDAEASVLSAVLLSGDAKIPAYRDALERVASIVRSDDFYSEPNRAIFSAALALLEAKAPIDIVSVGAWLRDSEQLAQVGGPSYLGQLSDATPYVPHVEHHAQIVAEKARKRRMIATCQRIAAEGYGDVGDDDEWMDASEQAIFEIVHVPQKSAMKPIGATMRKALQEAWEAAERGERLTGTPTGYERLDYKIAGLHEGDLMIVAARPGMGKTAFVMNVAVNVASDRTITEQHVTERRLIERHVPGQGVCVFSLEMPEEQLAVRMACSEARVDLGKMRAGLLQGEDWRALIGATNLIEKLPVFVDDTPAISPLELRAKVRRKQAEYNRAEVKADPARGVLSAPERKIGLVVVDYLQLMKGRDGVNSREQEISEISRGLKQLAKELRVPVIALSQLNRAVETRSTKDKRPQLSDLRESGAIEQDADTIIFIYRDAYYNPETTNARGIAELIIAKQRNGPTGKVLVRFTDTCTRFDNLAPGDYPDVEEQ